MDEMRVSILDSNLSDEQFHALSCSTRRKILLLVGEEPMCPRDIAEHLEMKMITIKRNISILLKCQLVIQSRKGHVLFYQTNQSCLCIAIK